MGEYCSARSPRALQSSRLPETDPRANQLSRLCRVVTACHEAGIVRFPRDGNQMTVEVLRGDEGAAAEHHVRRLIAAERPEVAHLWGERELRSGQIDRRRDP